MAATRTSLNRRSARETFVVSVSNGTGVAMSTYRHDGRTTILCVPCGDYERKVSLDHHVLRTMRREIGDRALDAVVFVSR